MCFSKLRNLDEWGDGGRAGDHAVRRAGFVVLSGRVEFANVVDHEPARAARTRRRGVAGRVEALDPSAIAIKGNRAGRVF